LRWREFCVKPPGLVLHADFIGGTHPAAIMGGAVAATASTTEEKS